MGSQGVSRKTMIAILEDIRDGNLRDQRSALTQVIDQLRAEQIEPAPAATAEREEA